MEHIAHLAKLLPLIKATLVSAPVRVCVNSLPAYFEKRASQHFPRMSARLKWNTFLSRWQRIFYPLHVMGLVHMARLERDAKRGSFYVRVTWHVPSRPA